MVQLWDCQMFSQFRMRYQSKALLNSFIQFTDYWLDHTKFEDWLEDRKSFDALIRVKDVEYKIHKVMLYKCSPYFRALFKCRLTEDTVFNIHGLSPDTMQLVIEFAYSDFVNVTEDNVQELMVAADMLNIMAIIQACSDFLCERLCENNCIGIWQFTNIYYSPKLQHKALRYITDHFEEVSMCEEFLQLSVQELAEVLGRDDLYVSVESSLFLAICNWIAHKPEERERDIALLLSKFRMALTTLQYIFTDVMSSKLVKSSAECQQMVVDAIQTIQYLQRQRPSNPVFRNPLIRPRLPKAILFAIGGMNGEGIMAYDVSVDRWVNVVVKMQRQWAFHGTVFHDGYVYCLGGSDRSGLFNRVSRLDLSTHIWHEMSPLLYSRCYLSVTVLNGSIYAIGGFNGFSRLKSAEYYRSEINQWICIASMHHSRSDASCTTLHNKIYICGGYDGNVIQQTAECYNPETNQWTLIASMSNRRAGIGVIGLADHVYAIGGSNSNHLRSVEEYNPRTNTWRWVTSMNTARSNFGLEVINDRIYVIGGTNGKQTTSSVEYFDSTTYEWTEACNLEKQCGALSCCVVFGIPNMAEYAVLRDSLPFLDLRGKMVEDAP
ncbi:kelch-like protein 10 isoform X1 [Solea solea]|uniref:kelch-like protein 10 isoform X1 n=1 Tax=Solea solea TaxID=90069 RepID=UPI00272CCC4A|nr:kelch-like protein 10 isoform X1 [Solea solea]